MGDGPIAGTLGCAEFDSAAVADAPTILDASEPSVRTYRHELGSVEVFLEPRLVPPTLDQVLHFGTDIVDGPLFAKYAHDLENGERAEAVQQY